LLTCAYDGREFVRVGYYVNNEYDSEELNLNPPSKPNYDRVKRNILAEKPRVTRFAIKWFVDREQILARYETITNGVAGIPKNRRLLSFRPSNQRQIL